MAGAYTRLGSTCSSSVHSGDITNLDGANGVIIDSALPSAEHSTSRYPTKPMLTPKEQRAVDELRAFLQHCLAQDYLLHVSSPPINGLGDHSLKLGSVPRAVHWRTRTGLFVSLQRCLEAKSLGEPTFKLSPFRFRVTGFNDDISRYVDRPAEIFGLDKEWVRKRIASYPSRICPKASDNLISKLVMHRQWDLLAETLLRDESTLAVIFQDVRARNKHTRKQQSLQTEIRSALNKIRCSYFVHLNSQTDFSLTTAAKNARGPWLLDNVRSSELQKIAQPGLWEKDSDERPKQRTETLIYDSQQGEVYRVTPNTIQYYENRLAIVEARLQRMVFLPQFIRPYSAGQIHREHEVIQEIPAKGNSYKGDTMAETGLEEQMEGILLEVTDIRKIMQSQREEAGRKKREFSLR
ncbi:MAG: hypothetical protein Q9187_002741 [Circinaria calcarea]